MKATLLLKMGGWVSVSACGLTFRLTVDVATAFARFEMPSRAGCRVTYSSIYSECSPSRIYARSKYMSNCGRQAVLHRCESGAAGRIMDVPSAGSCLSIGGSKVPP